MRQLAKAACVLLFFAVFMFPQAGSANPLVGVTGTLTYIDGPPGNATYRFDYSVENFSLEPYVWGFVVFFNSDGLDRSDFVSYAYPTGWEEVFVFPEAPEGGPWSVEWDGGPDHPNPVYPGQTLGGFSLTFIWKEINFNPGPQAFEAWNGEAYDGMTVVIPSGPIGVETTSWGEIKSLFR